MDLRSAVSRINKNGILLVFPVDNRREPASLWHAFYPRSEMRWEWDSEGDGRVAELWHMRERLSSSQKVVYSKWYRGRATVMSLELVPALLRKLDSLNWRESRLSFQAAEIIDFLDEDSPLSTKQIKRAAELTGKARERIYESAMKELWSRLLIVGFGEVDEGAFPSLAIGSIRVLFEDLWREAIKMSESEVESRIERFMPQGSLFRKYLEYLCAKRNAASQGL